MYCIQYLYSLFHNIDCIKAASQYQSKHNNNVRFLVEKYPRLVELIRGITDNGSFSVSVIVCVCVFHSVIIHGVIIPSAHCNGFLQFKQYFTVICTV